MRYSRDGPPNHADSRLRRDGFRCLACGSEDDLTVDHIQHQSAGGRHGIENLRTLCRSCNSRRGSGHLPEVDGEAGQVRSLGLGTVV
ncbi:HNH endonuclease [Streptomyces sp. NBC_00623]